ncbi:MAG: hypothetical protein EA390_14170 [Balneolaceae bacterium]|nr:MAG: hypothetical protein EA390_14170 [Balneolaceae bacterium]
MSLINKSDLKYDYDWSLKPGAKPRTSTTTKLNTKSRKFRRKDGNEVLSFINDYVNMHKEIDKEGALEIEAMLQDHPEIEDLTYDELREWLDDQIEKK